MRAAPYSTLPIFFTAAIRRALVGPHFASPPEVEHTDTVVSY